ncbi:MAG: electron-transfer flavoprotein:ubiquinone oxidoreductase [Candidatus Omnitrophota bacterium]
MSDVNVLIVGAGPAGLAAAIRLKQLLRAAGRKEFVAVFDKAQKLGYHNLSGAVFEAACLDELVPGWRESKDAFVESMVRVEKDDLYFLTPRSAFRIPPFMVPPKMHHAGDYAIAISGLVEWLGQIAEKEGVEIYTGFAGSKILHEGKKVQGIQLVDLGLGRDGKPKSNYVPGEKIRADVTVFADGSRGALSRTLTELLGEGKNPQVFSVGIKQLIKLPEKNAFGAGRAIHTLGYPSPRDVFGGGFLYSMGPNTVALGLILGLDWKYRDLDPQQELEVLKAHPWVAKLLEGHQVITTGVKTIPEGGYYALPKLFTDGALVIGDAAGFVNMEKIKGIHYAIYSGIAAAETIFEAIQKQDYSGTALSAYEARLKTKGILGEMWHARNFRQVFKFGLHAGAMLSKIQHWIPGRVRMERDRDTMKKNAALKRDFKAKIDKETFVGLSGAMHREDEPSHIKIQDAALCVKCTEKYGNPCAHFCPGQVYRMKDGEILLSPSNCMHDGSCAIKCPYGNILWTPPEGGEGPRFKGM